MIAAAMGEEGETDEEGNQNWFRVRVDKLVEVSCDPIFLSCTLFSFSCLLSFLPPLCPTLFLFFTLRSSFGPPSLAIFLCVCLSVCLSVCLYVCLSLCPSFLSFLSNIVQLCRSLQSYDKPAVECYLVDHGGRMLVEVKNMRRLLPEFEIFAHQGIRCALKVVNNSNVVTRLLKKNTTITTEF